MRKFVRGGVLVAVCSGALLLCGSAAGGTLFRQSTGQFNFLADPGETNQIAITSGSVPGRFVFTDLLEPITLGQDTADCTGGGTNTVSCPLAATVLVDVGDGNDGVSIDDAVPMPFRLSGRAGEDFMDGGGLGDVIDGGDGPDQLRGDGGDDRLLPNLGTDPVVDGGPGSDSVDYDDDRSTGVTVDLTTGTGAEGDVLTAIENVDGTFFADTLTGNAGDNVIRGNPGADTLADGGGGNDTLSYAGHAAPVTVNLATAIPADGDTITGRWEGAIGSPFDDQLLAAGAGFAVSLDGRDGNDRLVGGNFPDSIVGGEGADTLLGGPGADLLYGNTTAGTPDGAGDTVSYDDGRTTQVVSDLAGAHQDGDFYSDISNLLGGPGDDVLTGDAAANALAGGAGNDALTGGAGSDDLQGGTGDDFVQAADGEPDSVNCGPGVDAHSEDPIDALVECEAAPPVVQPPPAPTVVRCVVPNLKRMTVARARRLLTARRCRLGKVRRVYSRKVRKGRVISQNRRPGARLPRNARVNIVVSRGARRR